MKNWKRGTIVNYTPSDQFAVIEDFNETDVQMYWLQRRQTTLIKRKDFDHALSTDAYLIIKY